MIMQTWPLYLATAFVPTSFETIFAAVKWCGAAYLIYTGIKTFFSRQTGFAVEKNTLWTPVRSLRSLYPTGFFVGAGAALLATVKKG